MKLGWVIGLTITAILLAVWLLNVISVGVAMCRGSRAVGADGGGSTALATLVRQLPTVLWLASLATLNLVWFVLALCWYRLRGKPFPPVRRPGLRGL